MSASFKQTQGSQQNKNSSLNASPTNSAVRSRTNVKGVEVNKSSLKSRPNHFGNDYRTALKPNPIFVPYMEPVNLLAMDNKKLFQNLSKMISENKLEAEKLKKDIEKKEIENQRFLGDDFLYEIAQGLLENCKSNLVNLEQLIEMQLKRADLLSKQIAAAEQNQKALEAIEIRKEKLSQIIKTHYNIK